MKYETDNWPVIKARWLTKTQGKRAVRVIVIHVMEAPEKGTTAENVARYFQRIQKRQEGASAHICVDADSIVQCVMDNDVAWAAPGANHDGIQVELAGYTAQKREDWLDVYSLKMLRLASNAVAQYCLKFSIPPLHLSDEELKAGARGIVGHDQVSRVYKKSDHTDPGAGFPWLFFLEQVEDAIKLRMCE